MAARKRKPRRGPAKGTGGRPVGEHGAAAERHSWRLTPVDRERLDRLRALWGYDSDTGALRHALEMADAMMREAP